MLSSHGRYGTKPVSVNVNVNVPYRSATLLSKKQSAQAVCSVSPPSEAFTRAQTDRPYTQLY